MSSISRSERRDNVIESGCKGELAIEEQRRERLAEKTIGIGLKSMEKRNDFILIVGILVLALVAYLGITFYQGANTENAVAVVTVDDMEYGRFPLNEDRVERIELPDGSYNILEIKDGKADVTEASCPDGICVNHRAVSKQNQSIVCLPNKVVIVIENGAEADVDTVTN